MTIQQERDIAVAALEQILRVGRGTSGRIILVLKDEDDVRKALAEIAAIAAQASPVAQDARAEYDEWYSNNVPEFNHPVHGAVVESNVRIETWEAWQAGRASVAVPAAQPVCCPECGLHFTGTYGEKYEVVAQPVGEAPSEEMMNVLTRLAYRTLWLAFRWNDHNFKAAHIEAREACARVGIVTDDQADEWLEHGKLPPVVLRDSPPVAQDQDARRYRWLREQNWSDSCLCVVARPKDAVKLGHDCPAMDRLDEAIDAAIAATTKGAT